MGGECIASNTGWISRLSVYIGYNQYTRYLLARQIQDRQIDSMDIQIDRQIRLDRQIERQIDNDIHDYIHTDHHAAEPQIR